MKITRTVARQVRIIRELEKEIQNLLTDMDENYTDWKLENLEFLETSNDYLKLSFGHIDVEESLEFQMDANNSDDILKRYVFNKMSDFFANRETA